MRPYRSKNSAITVGIENLTPFEPGTSGNPNGRPKGVPNSKVRLLRLLELTQKKKNPVTGLEEEFTVAEQMDMAMIAKALKGDINAYKEIVDRLEGRAKQEIDTNLTGDLNLVQIIQLPSNSRDDNSDTPALTE